MASFLYLVLGVVIGLLGGWFLRGLRAGSATPTESTTTESSTTEVAATEPEPAAATEPVAEPEPVAAAEAEPVAATEPVAEPEPAAAAEPEPAAPAAEPELVTATATPEPVVAAPVVAEPVIVEPVITESPAADAGEPAAISQVDNLTKIAGIGPKAAAALTTAGITTYRQLADSDEGAIRAALAAAGMRATAAVAAWPERAKQLVDSGN